MAARHGLRRKYVMHLDLPWKAHATERDQNRYFESFTRMLEEKRRIEKESRTEVVRIDRVPEGPVDPVFGTSALYSKNSWNTRNLTIEEFRILDHRGLEGR